MCKFSGYKNPSRPHSDARIDWGHIVRVICDDDTHSPRLCVCQLSVAADSYALSKCFLPEESTVINVYCLAGACMMLLFLAHCLWMKGLLQCLSLVVLGKHKYMWATENAPQPRTEPWWDMFGFANVSRTFWSIFKIYTHTRRYCVHIGVCVCVFQRMCTRLVDYFLVVKMLLGSCKQTCSFPSRLVPQPMWQICQNPLSRWQTTCSATSIDPTSLSNVRCWKQDSVVSPLVRFLWSDAEGKKASILQYFSVCIQC